MDSRPGPDRWLEGGAVALCALLLLPFVLTSATSADEFTYLSHGLRQLGGQLIYRDFFEFVAPLSSGLAWAVFALVGPSLLAVRLVQAGLLLVACWQLVRLARALAADRWAAALLGPLLILGLYRAFQGFSHHWVALPLVLGTLQAAFRARERETPGAWALTGVLTGLCLLAMQSDGVALLGCLLVWLSVDAWFGRSGRAMWLARGTALAAGLFLPLAASGVYFAVQGALGAALTHMFVWPLNQYKTPGGINDVKYLTDLSTLTSVTVGWVNLPYWYVKTGYYLYLLTLLPGIALLVAAWGLDRLKARLKGQAWHEDQARLALVGGLAIAMWLLSMRGRADASHVAAYATPALLVAAAFASRWRRRMAEPGLLFVRGLPHLSLVAFLLAGGVLAGQAMRERPDQWLRLASPDARLAASPATRYLQAHAKPGDRLVAFPFGGFFYFYGLPPATRYSVMLPPSDGYYNPTEYQAFWRAMLAERPRYIVFAPYVALDVARPRYLLYPLTGYTLVATLPTALYDAGLDAEIYERQAP